MLFLGKKINYPFLDSLLQLMVEVTGIEPATSWSQTTRATNCATPRLTSFSIDVIYNNILFLEFQDFFEKKLK